MLSGTGDHWQHTEPPHNFIDLWEDRGPASHERIGAAVNNTHSCPLFGSAAIDYVRDHAEKEGTSRPLFLYLSWQDVHFRIQPAPTKCVRSVRACCSEEGANRVGCALSCAGGLCLGLRCLQSKIHGSHRVVARHCCIVWFPCCSCIVWFPSCSRRCFACQESG